MGQVLSVEAAELTDGKQLTAAVCGALTPAEPTKRIPQVNLAFYAAAISSEIVSLILNKRNIKSTYTIC